MRGMRVLRSVLSLFFAVACAEQVFEDSPALTTLWQASSSGQSEMFISQIIQNREFAQHRSSDGRGPMFWAFEFKNVETLALLLHLGVSTEQEDVDGKKPREFFPDDAAALAQFEADAKAKVAEMASLLSEREEEFYSYQQSVDEPEDYEDEDEVPGEPKAKSKKVDTIDYADEEEEEEGKDEM
ncbi:hypothetical protein AB1Y20_023747 [Prymnesium parvum]|uniref:Uncharacterized protein n=1 Tax=Prymnesium parvum TaxID=97485 RepID=A0AB34JEQ0_PRYPA|mmetsp:Transcript_36569/g.91053  ORF Transcript_36569/g.91053 Transcript_36569/m.91053 type:complete len:184 (+) Transcript_36569:27-578(+)